MSFFDSMSVSASGLTAQRLRMDIISENIANVNTTRSGDGTPYKRKTVLLQEQSRITPFSMRLGNEIATLNSGKGVKVRKIAVDESLGDRVYEPNHPDADEEGYVTMPNVNIVTEMVNMIAASRSYEANITAMNTTKGITQKTLEIGK